MTTRINSAQRPPVLNAFHEAVDAAVRKDIGRFRDQISPHGKWAAAAKDDDFAKAKMLQLELLFGGESIASAPDAVRLAKRCNGAFTPQRILYRVTGTISGLVGEPQIVEIAHNGLEEWQIFDIYPASDSNSSSRKNLTSQSVIIPPPRTSSPS